MCILDAVTPESAHHHQTALIGVYIASAPSPFQKSFSGLISFSNWRAKRLSGFMALTNWHSSEWIIYALGASLSFKISG